MTETITPTPPPSDGLDRAVSDGKKAIEAELKKNGSPVPASAPAVPGEEAPAVVVPGLPAPAPAEAPGVPGSVDDSVDFDMTEESIGDLYSIGFGAFASRPGMEHWELQEVERNQLAKATKAVLDRYGLKVSPVSALIMALGMTIGPRWYMGHLAKKERAQNPDLAPEPEPEKVKAGGKKEKPAPEAPAPEPEKVKDKSGWSGDDKEAGHEPQHTN